MEIISGIYLEPISFRRIWNCELMAGAYEQSCNL